MIITRDGEDYAVVNLLLAELGSALRIPQVSPDRATKKRTIRVKDDLWDGATESGIEGTTLAAVIRAALQVYVKGGKK